MIYTHYSHFFQVYWRFVLALWLYWIFSILHVPCSFVVYAATSLPPHGLILTGRHFYWSAVLDISHCKASKSKAPFASSLPSWRKKNLFSAFPQSCKTKQTAGCKRMSSPFLFFLLLQGSSSFGCSPQSMGWDGNQLHRRHSERPCGQVHTQISPSLYGGITDGGCLLGADRGPFGGEIDVNKLKLFLLPI